MTASPHAAPVPAPVPAGVTVYSTRWCGFCRRLTAELDRAGIAYDDVDIERQNDAAARVAAINGGNLTVPTVEFTDGSSQTNPSLREVRSKLAELS